VALPIPAETPRDDYIVEPSGETPVEPSPGDSNTLGEEANWADRTARSRGGSYIESEYGDQAGAAREGTVDAEQDIVKRFNERMQRYEDMVCGVFASSADFFLQGGQWGGKR
jgi:hypothetical protein